MGNERTRTLKGFAAALLSPRLLPVAALLLGTLAFVAAMAWGFGLRAILSPVPHPFPPSSSDGWLSAASIDFGADFVVHAIPMAFVAFGMLILFPALARRPILTLAGALVLSGLWHVVGFNWYLAPNAVLSDGVDDVLIIASVFTAALHCVIALLTRGMRRIRSMAATGAMGALIIETCVLHALVILPAAQVYDRQAQWLATALARPDTDPATLCRMNGLVCLAKHDGVIEELPSARHAPMPDVVVKRAIEAVEKYGIFEHPPQDAVRSWTIRHRSFTNYTGALRIPAIEFNRNEKRIVVVDMSFAPIANLWVRSYTHLHLLPVCIIWVAMLALMNSVHGRRKSS